MREWPAAVLEPGRAVHERARGGDLHGHVRELELHCLEACDRAAELPPRTRVGERELVSALRQAEPEGRDRDAAAVEDREELVQPSPRGPSRLSLGMRQPENASGRVSDDFQPIFLSGGPMS